MTTKRMPKQRSGRDGTAAGGAGGGKRRGKRATFADRFGLASLAYRVAEEYLPDLEHDIDAFCGVLHVSEAPDINKFKAMIARLGTDTRYAAIRPAFRQIQAHVRAGQWSEAWELVVGILNVTWERSQEYQVGRDAFFRRIRGNDFEPLRYANPLTSERGAALAWIMRQGESGIKNYEVGIGDGESGMGDGQCPGMTRSTQAGSDLVIEVRGKGWEFRVGNYGLRIKN